MSVTDVKMINMVKSSLSYMKQHPEVIFTRADKGNIAVAMNKEDYDKNEEFVTR